MPNDNTRVEIITGRERRRRYTANEKLALVGSVSPRASLGIVQVRARPCSCGPHDVERDLSGLGET